MNFQKNVNLLSVIVFFAVLTASCSSSKITHSWKSNENMEKNYRKLLVVAIAKTKDVVMKRKMEQHICEDLKMKGIEGRSSSEEFGQQFSEGIDEKEVLEKMSQSGYDGILTIVLLGKEREKQYIPGRVVYSPYMVYHRRFWGYYTTIYERIYEPGYYEINTKYFWESNLFDIESKKLIYSVQTKSFNPADTETLAHEYGKLICRDLFNAGVLSRSTQIH